MSHAIMRRYDVLPERLINEITFFDTQEGSGAYISKYLRCICWNDIFDMSSLLE